MNESMGLLVVGVVLLLCACEAAAGEREIVDSHKQTPEPTWRGTDRKHQSIVEGLEWLLALQGGEAERVWRQAYGGAELVPVQLNKVVSAETANSLWDGAEWGTDVYATLYRLKGDFVDAQGMRGLWELTLAKRLGVRGPQEYRLDAARMLQRPRMTVPPPMPTGMQGGRDSQQPVKMEMGVEYGVKSGERVRPVDVHAN